MTILAIDTSVGVSVAIVEDDLVLAEHNVDAHGVQGELTAHLVAQALAEANKQTSDVTDVVVGVGPGPFTGLRVGIACAHVFAFARNIPVHGMCSLDAVAFDYAKPCIVVSNARRSELYWAEYETDQQDSAHGLPVRGSAPGVLKPSALLQQFPDGHFVGPAAMLYPDVIQGTVLPLRAASLGRMFARGKATVLPVTPLYLRAPDAVEPGQPKSVLA